MRVQILTPTGILVDEPAGKVVVEAVNGSFCLLPRHIDVVAALAPGILALTNAAGAEEFLAVDEGILVKCADLVQIAVGRAVRGQTLDQLQQVVEEEFRRRDEHERMARTAIARIEASFIRSLLEEQRDL